eukprot:jgi/Ulvmu1/7937/UM004_0170.1
MNGSKGMKSGEQKSEGKTVRIESLPLDQLRLLQKQISQELEAKQKAAQVLASTASSFSSSRSAAQDLGSVKDGEKMMVPLTESLYVEGFVHEKDKILVDIGTGYFAERTCEEAADFCARKIQDLKENIDQIGEQIREKEQLQANVEAIMQDKMRALQQNSAEGVVAKPA